MFLLFLNVSGKNSPSSMNKTQRSCKFYYTRPFRSIVEARSCETDIDYSASDKHVKRKSQFNVVSKFIFLNRLYHIQLYMQRYNIHMYACMFLQVPIRLKELKDVLLEGSYIFTLTLSQMSFTGHIYIYCAAT